MPISSVDLSEKLDQLERSLPTIPAKSMAFGRATIRRTNDVVTSVASDVARRIDRVVKVARTGASSTAEQTRDAGEQTAKTATSAVRQTAGQARSAAEQTRKVAESAVKQTVGQAKSGAERTRKAADSAAKRVRREAGKQAGRTAQVAGDETRDALDDATAKVDPDAPPRGTPYEQWTKAQLYDRAQELDIEGRSTMSKQQLVKALRAA